MSLRLRGGLLLLKSCQRSQATAQGPLWVRVFQSCLQNAGGRMSVGAVLGMSTQPGPTVRLSFLSPRAVGHTPIKSECLGRRRWRQVRAIMAGWTAWHTVGQIPSPSRSKSKYRGGSCRSHRPVQSRRLAYVLWRDPHVPRNLLNQQRMTGQTTKG